MLSRIYVHKQRLRAGKPAIAIRTYRGVRYARRVRVGGVVLKQEPCPKCPVVKVYLETTQEVKTCRPRTTPTRPARSRPATATSGPGTRS